MNEPLDFDALARAVADSKDVDWAALSGDAASDQDRGLIDQLRLLALISRSAASDQAEETRAPRADTPPLGTWGPLELLEEIGRGAFGRVYRARDPRLDREVALKLLEGPIAEGDERFVREAQVLARVRHPHVVVVYGADVHEGRAGLWMELIRGRTLAALLREQGPFGSQEAALVGVTLCSALAAVHAAGLVHRDVKAHNVVRETGGRLVLMDFGAGQPSRASEAGVDAEVTGTPLYMAPELFEGATASAATDIYAVGVLLFHLMTATYPVRGRTVAEIRGAHTRGERRLLREVRPEALAPVAQVIERALAVDPAARYRSAAAMEQALSATLHVGGPATVSPVAQAAPQEASTARWRWVRARTAKWAVAAAGALILAGAVAVTLRLAGRAGEPIPSGPPEATFTQLTSAPGLEIYPSMSPDGKWFVYVSAAAGNEDIYLQAVGGQKAINLTQDSPANDTQPAFSPDGERIAFRSARDDGGIFVMGRTGESVRRVTKDGFAPAWSPDGREIVYTSIALGLTPYASYETGELWIADVETGQTRLLRSGTAGGGASWSPNGRRLAYRARPAGADSSPGNGYTTASGYASIWTIAADGSAPVQVSPGGHSDWSPVWSPDGRFLYYASDAGGSLDAWRVPLDEISGEPAGAPERVAAPAPFVGHFSMARERQGLAFTSFVTYSNLHRAPFDARRAVVSGDLTSITTGSREWGVGSIDVSPDGNWLAFYSGNPRQDIYVSRTDGSNLRQLTNEPAMDNSARWSADGQTLFFLSRRRPPEQVWRIGVDGSNLAPVTDVPGGLSRLVPSPDRIRAVSHVHMPKDTTLLLVNLETSGAAQTTLQKLATFGGQALEPDAWSPDGKWLAGHLLPGGGTVLYSFDTGEFETVSQLGNRSAVWLSDSRRLLFLDDWKLFVLDVPSRTTREILSLAPERIRFFALSPDERWLYMSVGPQEADIWMATLKP